MLGQISSTIITAISMIIVARIIGPINYGQVTIAYIPISIASLFTDLGVNGALVKYIAQYRSENKISEARSFIKTGLTINAFAGSILSIFIFILSGYLATTVFHQPELHILIKISSINLLAQSLINTAKSIFIGYERMELVSLMVMIQSILKTILAPVLVFLGYSTLGPVSGQTVSLVVAGIVGFILIQMTVKSQRITEESHSNFYDVSLTLLSFGAPLFLSILLSGSIGQIYKFLMVLHVTPSDVGNYQAAINFTVLISFFTMPIATVLFPLFSKIPQSDNDRLAAVYQNAVKYSALITVPITSALILLSEPLVHIVYGSTYAQTSNYLKWICIPYLLIGIGAQINASLLNGQGKTKTFFMSHILNFIVGLPMSLYLIPRMGVTGLLITTILAPLTGLIFTNLRIKRDLGFSPRWGSTAKIYLSSAIAFTPIYILLSSIRLQEWTQLIIGGGAYITLYLITTKKLKTLTTVDIENLRLILSSMGPLTPLFNLFLSFFEKTIDKNNAHSQTF